MTLDDLEAARANANMIVCGYAFRKTEDSNIEILQLRTPFHALVMSRAGEVLETTMDDVELDIVKEYWAKNQKCMEEAYA